MHKIAFVSPLGGCGQTSLLANLSTLWIAQGRACLAIELCAQNSLSSHLGHWQHPQTDVPAGWSQCLQQGRWWGHAALQNSAGVRLLPFGPADVTASATLEHTLAAQPHWLRQQLEDLELEDDCLVLLDAPAWPHALARQALECADTVVVCLDASARAVQVQPQVQALLQHAAQGARPGVVATRFDPRRPSQRSALQTLQQQWGVQLAPNVLHEDESLAAAHQQQHCVSALAPQAQSAHDIQGMARWLLQTDREAGNGGAAAP